MMPPTFGHAARAIPVTLQSEVYALTYDRLDVHRVSRTMDDRGEGAHSHPYRTTARSHRRRHKGGHHKLIVRATEVSRKSVRTHTAACAAGRVRPCHQCLGRRRRRRQTPIAQERPVTPGSGIWRMCRTSKYNTRTIFHECTCGLSLPYGY